MAIRVLIVDDHAMLRGALRALVAADPEFEVAGEAAGGEESVRLTRELRPDVIVMDLSMPEVDGITATREAVAAHPGARVIAFSAHLDRALFDRAFDVGAIGYVLKDLAHEELAAAIRTVAAGKRYVSPRVARELGVPGESGS
jgi:DNA-binding NarL/FixJ family response regulator